MRGMGLAAFALGLACCASAAAKGPGAVAVAAGVAADVHEIRDLRAASNQGIAAHSAAEAVAPFAEDAVFVFGGGGSAVGRKAMAAAFASDFADPAFVTYVRAPTRIRISDTGARAVEHGTWTGLWRQAAGETRYRGDYTANWAHTPSGWRVRGELYVTLQCEGPRCKP